MRYENFEQLKEQVLKNARPMKCAVVMAHERHVLEAVIKAKKDGMIRPVLLGNKAKILQILKDMDETGDIGEIFDVTSQQAAMEVAIEMVHNNDAECLMKGIIPTDVFMGAVLKRESNLRESKTVSMLSFREIPHYHKLLAFTDTGICPHPTLEQKADIIQNAVDMMNEMGIDNPKVAVLAASEQVSSKMPESADAAKLQEMCEQGGLPGCVVEGPMSMDTALSKEAAWIKGLESQVAGDADLLVFPDLVSANVTTKTIAFLTQAPAGVLILGTKVPLIVSSRSATTETKCLCITLAAAKKRNQKQV